MAVIQFVRGKDEEVIPDIRLTRAKDGGSGRAFFYFDNPQIIQEGNLDILGMYMIDDEGEVVAREVNAKFVNGQAKALEVVHSMRSVQEWDRFMRFMERYAESHNLDFNKA